MAPYRDVQSGASLLLAHSPARSDFRSTCLLIGAGALAAARATACLDAGYRIVCLPSSDAAPDPELGWRAKRGELELLDRLEDGDGALGRWLDDEAHADMVDDIAFVVLTDTIASAAGQPPRSAASAAALRRTCFKRRLALSVADMPSLSDFSFPATHRFPLAHGKGASPLQLALTTNSSSCRLAARLRRTLVAALPRDVGSAVVRIRDLRAAVRAEQAVEDEEGEDESWSSRGPLNKPVEQLVGRHTPPLTPPNTPPAVDRSFVPPPALVRANTQDEPALTALTRMRFIAQICACDHDTDATDLDSRVLAARAHREHGRDRGGARARFVTLAGTERRGPARRQPVSSAAHGRSGCDGGGRSGWRGRARGVVGER